MNELIKSFKKACKWAYSYVKLVWSNERRITSLESRIGITEKEVLAKLEGLEKVLDRHEDENKEMRKQVASQIKLAQKVLLKLDNKEDKK